MARDACASGAIIQSLQRAHVLVIILLATCSTITVGQADNLALQLPRSTLLGYSINEWQSLLNQLADAEHAHPLGTSEDSKHPTPLTNLYFRLHRQLFASGHLPASEWGRAYPGQTPVGTHDLQQINLSLMPEFTRASINRFWELHKDDIPPNARCLEFAPLFYSTLTERCSERWSLRYEASRTKWHTDRTSLTLYADLSHFASVRRLPRAHFDVIIATQALQYPADSVLMARALQTMLQPRGILLLTAPSMERVDGAYPDRYRFTQRGVETVLTRAGFAPRATYVGGNTMLATAFLMGFSVTDISMAERHAAVLVNTTDGQPGGDVYYGVYGVWDLGKKDGQHTPRMRFD